MSFLKKEDEHRTEREKMMAFEEAKENARIMAMKTNDFSPDSKEWYKRLKSDIKRKSNADCYRPIFPPPQSP